MDDQYNQMQLFYRELTAFNELLRASMREVDQCHGVIDGLWRDEFRKRYDTEWDSYKHVMQRYIQQGAFAYEQFLQEQLRDLEKYLFGR